MASTALLQARLNVIHPSIFPLHQYAALRSSPQNGNLLESPLPASEEEKNEKASERDAPQTSRHPDSQAWSTKESNPVVAGGK